MLVELRSSDRLRGPKAVDVGSILTSVLHAARDGTADLSRLRVVCDWIQYKRNFREPIARRPILPSSISTVQAHRNGAVDGEPEACELAIDLRRAAGTDLNGSLSAAVNGDASNGVYLEGWGPGAASCIWSFNGLYWRALGLWEQATGRGYEQALPRGESDARNSAAARDLILELFAVWDNLASRRALPDELHVLELGVGNGIQAKV